MSYGEVALLSNHKRRVPDLKGEILNLPVLRGTHLFLRLIVTGTVRFYRKEGNLGWTEFKNGALPVKDLPGFAMDGMTSATRAVLFKLHPFSSLILAFGRGVVPFGAYNAG